MLLLKNPTTSDRKIPSRCYSLGQERAARKQELVNWWPLHHASALLDLLFVMLDGSEGFFRRFIDQVRLRGERGLATRIAIDPAPVFRRRCSNILS